MRLPNDTALRCPDFTIISASAGSGKTHTLTLKLLQLLLSSRVDQNLLRNILAITFTNNAAAEMRNRLLEYLKRGALAEEETLTELAGVIEEDRATLIQRCSEMVERILSDYSAFQIQTIDSFLTRVFRASALEFGLPPSVQVVLDNRAMLDQAFEEFTRNLAVDPAQRMLLNRLTDLLVESQRHGLRFVWSPFDVLSGVVRELYDAMSAQPKDILGHPDLLTTLRTAEQEIVAAYDELSDLVRRSGLESNQNFLRAAADAAAGDVETLIGRKAVFGSPLKKSGTNAKARREVDEWNDRCAPVQERLERLAQSYFVLRSRTHYEPFIQAHQLFRSSIDAVSRRSGQISLTDVNRTLLRSMDASMVPQVYLYFGDTIYHYLIDEFQDTAPVQWEALRPLIEEALAKEGSLFVVGDTKQSIYAFRHADWQIMRRLMDEAGFASIKPAVLRLETNYRSGGQLVAFTTEVFRQRVPALTESGAANASGLSTVSQQVKEGRAEDGSVEVMRFEADAEDEPQRAALIAAVRDCVARGYRYADITVLTPRNSDVIAVSSWLNSEAIPFISHSGLDIRSRAVVGDLLALLRFLNSPVDDLSFAAFLLGTTFRRMLGGRSMAVQSEAIRAFLLETAKPAAGRRSLYVRFREAYPELWANCFEELLQVTGYLPMYDLVCEIFHRFDLFRLWPEEEAALTRFLEAASAFEKEGTNELTKFLSSADEEESGGWSIDAPQGIDAVNIMTIHKAKGLDNRVVIVLLVDAQAPPVNRFFDEQEEGVELVHIRKAWTEWDDHLKRVYEAEAFHREVDGLNKLYVALTRAKDEMVILVVASEKRPGASRFFPVNETWGVKRTARTEDRFVNQPAPVHHSTVRAQRERPLPSKLGIVERHRGDAMHEALKQIVFIEEDVEQQVRRALRDISSLFPDIAPSMDLAGRLSAFLAVPDVKACFEERAGRTILVEQEFVDGEGHLFRMDRVVIDPDRVTVIDYKTGDEKEGYDEQVRGYMAILRSVYPGRPVNGVLAFIDRLRTREVA